MNEGHRTCTDQHDSDACAICRQHGLFPMKVFDFFGAFDDFAKTAYAYAEAFIMLFVTPYLAPILAFATSLLRAAYHNRKPWRTRFLEGALLALVTVAVKPVLLHMGMSADMAVFCGVFMGFVGVDTLSAWLKRYMEGRIDGRKP